MPIPSHTPLEPLTAFPWTLLEWENIAGIEGENSSLARGGSNKICMIERKELSTS